MRAARGVQGRSPFDHGSRRPCEQVESPLHLMLLGRIVYRRFHRFVALALVAASCATVLPHGVALCVADDGHVAIETAHGNSPCFTDSRRHHGAGEGLGCAESGYHPCSDFSLSEGAEHFVASKCVPTTEEAPLAFSLAGPAIRPSTAIESVPVSRATVSQSLKIVRTTVLTI